MKFVYLAAVMLTVVIVYVIICVSLAQSARLFMEG